MSEGDEQLDSELLADFEDLMESTQCAGVRNVLKRYKATLVKNEVVSEEALQGLTTGQLMAYGLPTAAAAALKVVFPTPTTAVMRGYTVKKKGMKDGVRFQARATATLDEVKQAIREALPAFKRLDFTVWHQKVEVTTDQALQQVANNTPKDKPVTLFVQSCAVAFSSRITGTREDLLQELLCVKSHDGLPEDSSDLLKQMYPDPPPRITHTQGGTEQTVTFDELINVIVHLFIFRLEAMRGFPESEMNHRGFIDAIMVASVLVARELYSQNFTSPDHQVQLKPEGVLLGRLGLGKVDWLVVYRTLAVLVMEAKKGEIEKAWGQLYRELRAMRDNLEAAAGGGTDSKKRTAFEAFDLPQMPSYAVICTARDWRVVKYMPAHGSKPVASIQQSTFLVGITRQQPVDKLKTDIKHAVLTLAGVLIQQMTALDKVIAHNPGLPSAGAYTEDEMKYVDLAEAEAALEAAGGGEVWAAVGEGPEEDEGEGDDV